MDDGKTSPDENKDTSWEDPAPSIQGVLLSDAIAYYIGAANLIEDWVPENIKPASYALRLGERYYRNGKLGTLKKDEKLTLPSNSITYVSMLEKVNMPLYMIARFNLKIALIYKGIILGTGPQVDPGFKGHLSCPLHNISNNDIDLVYGEGFATIDFIKTSKFPSGQDSSDLRGMTLEKIYEHYSKDGVPGYKGNKLILFPKDKLARKKLDNYLPHGISLFSSLKDMEDRLKDIEKRNKLAVLTVIGVLATLFIGGTTLWWNQFEYFRDLQDRMGKVIARNATLAESKKSLEKRFANFEEKLITIESELRQFPGETSREPLLTPSGVVSTEKKNEKVPSN